MFPNLNAPIVNFLFLFPSNIGYRLHYSHTQLRTKLTWNVCQCNGKFMQHMHMQHECLWTPFTLKCCNNKHWKKQKICKWQNRKSKLKQKWKLENFKTQWWHNYADECGPNNGVNNVNDGNVDHDWTAASRENFKVCK